MNVTADERRRVTLPKSAKPGEVFAVEESGAGKFVLTRLLRPKPKGRLIREGRYLVGVTEHVITQEMVRELQDEFP